ncbi:BTAD domain-containing putative transcriptional regulator [Nocardioides flavescens]|uniref:AAA family ATPase n=1 Tax=Nocardioides flavescens TaxID=2691959 RepID=A0A6L7ESG4_9ACTN|nr:BTAD domain-containing putative transcriptional regulator [Nocardioides flavescens]MXG88478.1 AAA family ATPase [Nocardioides flavescens]
MIRVLGPLEVHGEAAAGAVDVGSPRHREVLAALVVDAGRVVSTDSLLDRVWGDVTRGGTTTNLHAIISRLRGRLREGRTGVELSTVPPGYRIDVPVDGVDATMFLDSLAQARDARTRGDLETARRVVREGLALWRGPAYADIAQPFAEAEAARLEGQRIAAVELAAEVDLMLGRHDEVLEELPALVAEHPLRESLRGHLMLALYRGGRQSDALAAYDDVREQLSDELGLDPGPQLQELRQRILEQDQTLLAPATSAAPPGAPTEPPVESAPAGQGGLRSDFVVPTSRLLGRDREIAYVRSLLEGSTQRLVTLTGTGGVGKTRLAAAISEASVGAYADGVVAVSLAPLTDPDLVLPEVARALGITGGEVVDPAAAVAEHLRSRRVLLVLDNLEHLLPAATSLSRLIASCPDLTVLVTSRTVLRVRGEVQYQVQPLPLPEPEEADPDALAESAAVALFVDRARSVAPEFDLAGLDPDNLAAVGAICRRLAGLPLAIELAAARVRLMPPTTMLARLDDVVAGGGARDLPLRQRTMRAALDWSHDLLDDEAQRLLHRLSVCSGGFTLEAAEAVGGGPGVLATLESLVEHSLVVTDLDNPTVSRFRMLEPVSQYAALWLEGEERLAARAAHREHFRALAAELEPAYRGPGTFDSLAVAEREHANLVTAIETGLADGDADLAGWLAWDLWLFWWLRGALVEGRRLTSAVLAEDVDDHVRVYMLAVHAAMAFAQGELATAREGWEEGDGLGERIGDGVGRSHNLAGIGLVALGEGDLDRAVEGLEATIALCEEIDLAGAWMWTLAHTWLGTVRLLQGDLEAAQRCVDRALAAAHGRHDSLATYMAHFTAAQVALARDDAATARDRLEEGVRLSLDTSDLANLAYFLDALALVESRDGAHERVATLRGAAARVREGVSGVVYGYYKVDSAELTAALEHARSELGDAAYAAALARGRAMSVADAVDLVLARTAV